jgi:hypothetical protein
MMHILAMMIFLGALALSIATIAWMLATNRVKIGAALLGQSDVAVAPLGNLAHGYLRRNRRSGATYVSLTATSVPRLAA